MGGSAPNTQGQQRSYDAGYGAFKSGQPDPSTTRIKTNDSFFDYYKYGYSAAQAEARAAQQKRQSEHAMSGMMAGMAKAQQEQAAQFQQMMRRTEIDRQAKEEAARVAAEQARRDAGVKRRDQLFSERLTNASLATDYITNQLNEEASTARLMGVDFNVSDDQKSSRISDYFATLWGEGSERELEALIKEWGSPDGFTGTWDIVRGNAKNFTNQAKPDTSSTIATGKGVPRLATLATMGDEEEALLG